MTVYLVRHDEVNASGLCYGQTDMTTMRSFSEGAADLVFDLPKHPSAIYSSPLSRCLNLAEHCFHKNQIVTDARLMEVNFGDWENRLWDDIPREALDQWALTPTDFQFPNGESLSEFQQRIYAFADSRLQNTDNCVVFTHAGVIRLLCAWYSGQSWDKWLTFKVPFLKVVRLANQQIV